MMLRLFAAVIALATLAGCITPPPLETVNQRLAYAEVQFEGAANSARDLFNQDLVPPDQIDTVLNSLDAARLALDTWHATPTSSPAEEKWLFALRTTNGLINALRARMRQPVPGPVSRNNVITLKYKEMSHGPPGSIRHSARARSG